jgi:hypothetical protein
LTKGVNWHNLFDFEALLPKRETCCEVVQSISLDQMCVFVQFLQPNANLHA